MKNYRYIGTDVAFLNSTALGRQVDGQFKIQVDEFTHGMSHGWHAVNPSEWTEIR